MTHFRDAKVCNQWVQVRIDDHRVQSEYKNESELQNTEGKNLYFVLCMRGKSEHDINDNVTTKTQNTFNTAHMNIDT